MSYGWMYLVRNSNFEGPPYWRDWKYEDNTMASIWKGNGWIERQQWWLEGDTITIRGYFNKGITGLLVPQVSGLCRPQFFCPVVTQGTKMLPQVHLILDGFEL
jgi:hypothetical protein